MDASASKIEIFNKKKEVAKKFEILKNNLSPEKKQEIELFLQKIEEGLATKKQIQDAEIKHFQEIVDFIEAQRHVAKELELATLIAEKIKSGAKIEKITMENIGNLFPNFYKALDEPTKAEIEKDWNMILEIAQTGVQIVKNPKKKVGAKETKETNKLDLLYDLVKSEPALAIGATLLGAWAVKKTWNWLLGKKKKDESQGAFGKIWDKTNNLFFLGASFFVAGKLVGKEKFGSFIKELTGHDLSRSRIAQAAHKLSNGDFAGMLDVIRHGVNPDEILHENISAAINGVSKKALSIVARSGKTYSEWIKFDIQNIINLGAKKLGIPISLISQNTALAEEIKTLKEYLASNDELFSKNDKMDVVLRKVFTPERIAKLASARQNPESQNQHDNTQEEGSIHQITKHLKQGEVVAAAGIAGNQLQELFSSNKEANLIILQEKNSEIPLDIPEKEKVILRNINKWQTELSGLAEESESGLAIKYVAGKGMVGVLAFGDFVLTEVLPFSINLSNQSVDWLNKKAEEKFQRESTEVEIIAEKVIAGFIAANLTIAIGTNIVGRPIKTYRHPLRTVGKIMKDGISAAPIRSIKNMPKKFQNIHTRIARSPLGSLISETPAEKFASGRISSESAMKKLNVEISKLRDRKVARRTDGKSTSGIKIKSLRKWPFHSRTKERIITKGLDGKEARAIKENHAINKAGKKIDKLQKKQSELIKKGAPKSQVNAVGNGIKRVQRRAFRNPDITRGIRSKIKANKLFRVGRGVTKLAGLLSVLGLGASITADKIEASRLENKLEILNNFDKDNKIKGHATVSVELLKGIEGETPFENIPTGTLTINSEKGIKKLVFEKGWVTKIILKDVGGVEILNLDIPEGSQTPIEEFMEDCKQKAKPEYVEVDILDPNFLMTIHQSSPASADKIKKYLKELKLGSKQRNLKICVNKHYQNALVLIDIKGKVKNTIPFESIIAENKVGQPVQA